MNNYKAVGTHSTFGIDTGSGVNGYPEHIEEGNIACAVCEEEIDVFYCGYNVNEYDAQNLVCEEWDCWKDICLERNYDSLPFGDYPELNPNIEDDIYHIIEQEMLGNGSYKILLSEDKKKYYCEECPNETSGFYLCDDCEEEQFNKDEEMNNDE